MHYMVEEFSEGAWCPIYTEAVALDELLDDVAHDPNLDPALCVDPAVHGWGAPPASFQAYEVWEDTPEDVIQVNPWRIVLLAGVPVAAC